MSEYNGRSSSKFVDLTKTWLPVASVIFLVCSAVTGTAIVVAFQKDTQRDIAASDTRQKLESEKLHRDMDDMQRALLEQIKVLQDIAQTHITDTAFENWRLRMQWANRTKDVDFSPEFHR